MIKYIIICVSVLFYPAEIEWAHYEDAKKHSVETNTPIFLFLSLEDCKWCERMLSETLSDQGVMSFINENFVAGNMHFSRSEMRRSQFLKRFKIGIFPTVLIINSEGQVVERLSGYQDANMLIDRIQKHGK